MNPEEPVNSSVSMKESVRDFLQGNLNRRSFLTRLTALGFTAAAAQNFSQVLAAPKLPASPADGPVSRVQGNGGAILVEQLKRCGVEFIFGNPSSHNGPIFDALIDRKDMHLILGTNENTLTAIADGYGKASGKTPFVTVSRPRLPEHDDSHLQRFQGPDSSHCVCRSDRRSGPRPARQSGDGRSAAGCRTLHPVDLGEQKT